MVHLSISLRNKRFPCGLGSKNEERESKTARKVAQVKERGGGGEERKETLADKPRDFENRPSSRKKNLTFQKRSKKMLLHWRANLADQNKQQPLKINIRVTYHTVLSV